MYAMPDSEDDNKFELERLRVASDLRQLAKETPNQDLKEHCLRIAEQWSDEAEELAQDDTGVD